MPTCSREDCDGRASESHLRATFRKIDVSSGLKRWLLLNAVYRAIGERVLGMNAAFSTAM